MLLVEVLHRAWGLDDRDLKASAIVDYGGTDYRVLDPVVMLKAKAANVRDFKQHETPPRHDREHLQLIARCLPPYLREVEYSARLDTAKSRDAAAVVSRAFEVLQNGCTATTLREEGIMPAALMPSEFRESPIDKIRNAYRWQMPRLIASAGPAIQSQLLGNSEPITERSDLGDPSEGPSIRI